MTSKKGSLWKSSWNRGRGTPIPEPAGDMAYFRDFFANDGADVADYESAAPTLLGQTLPFWYAAVGIRDGSGGASIGSRYSIRPASASGQVSVTAVASGDAFLPPPVLPVPGDDFISAVLVTVVTDGSGGVIATIFVDAQVTQVLRVPVYLASSAVLSLDPFVLPNGLHGFAGGSALPSTAEILTWFSDLKSNLEIQAIPGKTSHLYSATAVFPLVPAVLVNIANPGTDDLDLVTLAGAPAPANALIPTRFPY